LRAARDTEAAPGGDVGNAAGHRRPDGTHDPVRNSARGNAGQYAYVDQVKDVVIAALAADRRTHKDGVHEQNTRIGRAIANRP